MIKKQINKEYCPLCERLKSHIIFSEITERIKRKEERRGTHDWMEREQCMMTKIAARVCWILLSRCVSSRSVVFCSLTMWSRLTGVTTSRVCLFGHAQRSLGKEGCLCRGLTTQSMPVRQSGKWFLGTGLSKGEQLCIPLPEQPIHQYPLVSMTFDPHLWRERKKKGH